MMVFLVKAHRQSKLPATVSKIQSLMRYSVETGLITSFTAIFTLALFLGMKNTNYLYLLYFSLSKVYANTLLATLNARTALVNSAHKPTRSSGSGISSQTHHNSNYLWRDMELRPADTGSTGVHGIHTTAVDIDISNNDSVQALELKCSYALILMIVSLVLVMIRMQAGWWSNTVVDVGGSVPAALLSRAIPVLLLILLIDLPLTAGVGRLFQLSTTNLLLEARCRELENRLAITQVTNTADFTTNDQAVVTSIAQLAVIDETPVVTPSTDSENKQQKEEKARAQARKEGVLRRGRWSEKRRRRPQGKFTKVAPKRRPLPPVIPKPNGARSVLDDEALDVPVAEVESE
ncbi:hypothetical protein BDV98DRAFT_619860 [Pterulicium gracile]|uniref:DUF6534 domain-containing protein n=1 Tax=Pterulicium gracile TaxID=1884261 RepID=A0A5C3QLD5_9AGAR|nr:hypothetical protein BDV98DRAFT_619860 [Pterula gracilis]